MEHVTVFVITFVLKRSRLLFYSLSWLSTLIATNSFAEDTRNANWKLLRILPRVCASCARYYLQPGRLDHLVSSTACIRDSQTAELSIDPFVSDTFKQLLVSEMNGPDHDAVLHNPTWPNIESAIRRMDGNLCSLLILGIGDPAPHMGIGGGDDNRYIVYVTPDNWVFYNLINPNATPGQQLLVAGGQPAEYPNRQCVGLSEVLCAAKTYSETGQLNPSLVWEQQDR